MKFPPKSGFLENSGAESAKKLKLTDSRCHPCESRDPEM
jgi:hypothetical protein